MKRRLLILAAVAGLAAAPAALPAGVATSPAVATAKPCGAGYTHAVVPGGDHKCLRAGQFCSRKPSYQRVYKRRNDHLSARSGFSLDPPFLRVAVDLGQLRLGGRG
jgi:hypothetical protein